MCIETLAIALVVLVILYLVNKKVVPGEYQTIGWIVILAVAAIWLFKDSAAHLHGLFHLSGC